MNKTNGQKKKIGLVLSSVPGYSETFFRSKIKGLQNHGYEVLLFVDSKKKGSLIDCPVVSSPNFSKRNIYLVFVILLSLFKMIFINTRKSLKLNKLDKNDQISFKKRVIRLILIQHFMNYKLDWLHFGYATLAKDRENLAEAMGAKMAVSFRGFDLYLSPLKHPNCYSFLFKKEVRYHVLSQAMYNMLKSKSVPEKNIFIIPPAIDTELFKNSNNSAKNQNPLIQITTVARLHWIKGLDYFFRALKIIQSNGVDFNCNLIGTGEEMERLVFVAHQLGISERINFIGKIKQKEIVEYLEQTDIYVQYSIQEGFCNSVLEAQAMGVFCIVSDADGLVENVIDGFTGWVVPKRSPESLAKKILEVINITENEKEQIKLRAMERVRNDFNLEKQEAKFLNFYMD